MAKSPQRGWRLGSLSPLDIALDRQNPRISVEESDNESDIIKKLVQHEEIVDLARKIAKAGLLPGERVIVTKEGNQFIVLEGNRRICACKLLLSPELVPTEYKKQFPKLSTASEIERIQRIPVDVAPDRRSAEHILTLRHTEPGIRKWKPVARMRRVKRLLDEGFTVDEIAAEYNATPSNIRKTIREYRLLRLAEELKGLTASERKDLNDPDLKTNPYTRFFELAGVKEFLGLEFTPSGLPVIRQPRRQFDERLKKIVRSLLINTSSYDTRSNPGDVLGSEFKKFSSSRDSKSKGAVKAKHGKAADSSTSADTTRSKPTTEVASGKYPDRFFESLTCRIADNNIASVVLEIKKISADQYPISGTYLLRTLIELCLRYLVQASGKAVPSRGDPTLTDLVNFSLQNRDIFPTRRMADVIEAARNQKSFEYLNIVAQQRWMNADSTALKSVANQLRNFIMHVVEGGQ
jgi:hypothetical protein